MDTKSISKIQANIDKHIDELSKMNMNFDTQLKLIEMIRGEILVLEKLLDVYIEE